MRGTWKTQKELLRLSWRCASLFASFFTVIYLLISNTWITQIRQSTQALGEMFLYMCQTQSGSDWKIEVAFPSPRSSRRVVRGTVYITIYRDQEKRVDFNFERGFFLKKRERGEVCGKKGLAR